MQYPEINDLEPLESNDEFSEQPWYLCSEPPPLGTELPTIELQPNTTYTDLTFNGNGIIKPNQGTTLTNSQMNGSWGIIPTDGITLQNTTFTKTQHNTTTITIQPNTPKITIQGNCKIITNTPTHKIINKLKQPIKLKTITNKLITILNWFKQCNTQKSTT